MMTSRHPLIAFLLALCLCAMPCAAGNAADDPASLAQSLADGVIAYKLASAGADDVQSWLDGPLAQSAGAGAEWYVLALSQRGEWDFTAYRSALLACMEGTQASSASTRLKHALLLAATGSTDAVIAQTLSDAAGKQGVMSHVFALHLLNNGVTAPDVTLDATLAALLSLQYGDGGWALYGAASDPDVTAMVLQALAPHRDDPAIHAAIARALTRLSSLQRAEGDYASFGTPNPETTSQVLLALSELGLDAMVDERFIKDGQTLLDGLARYRLPDGSFSHRLGDVSNESSTSQAFMALTAYLCLQDGQPGLYVLESRADFAPAAPAPSAHLAPGWRLIAAAAILVAALLAMLVLFAANKRHGKNFLSVLIIAGVLIALVSLTDFQSADSYYSGQLPAKPDAIGTVTLSIRCDLALGLASTAHLPPDGVLLAPTAIPISSGDTVFTILTEAAQAFGIHLEASGSDGMRYVRGMGNLYEFDGGDLSGWLYAVNGQTPSVGCDQCSLSDGDVVEWAYSLDMGGDLGYR